MENYFHNLVVSIAKNKQTDKHHPSHKKKRKEKKGNSIISSLLRAGPIPFGSWVKRGLLVLGLTFCKTVVALSWLLEMGARHRKLDLKTAVKITINSLLCLQRKADEQVSSSHESAFAIAAVAVGLWSEHPDVGELLMAHLQALCPYILPFYPPRLPNQSSADYHRSVLGILYFVLSQL